VYWRLLLGVWIFSRITWRVNCYCSRIGSEKYMFKGFSYRHTGHRLLVPKYRLFCHQSVPRLLSIYHGASLLPVQSVKRSFMCIPIYQGEHIVVCPFCFCLDVYRDNFQREQCFGGATGRYSRELAGPWRRLEGWPLNFWYVIANESASWSRTCLNVMSLPWHVP